MHQSSNGLRIVAGTGASVFAAKIAAAIDELLVETEIGRFPDDEVKVRLKGDVRGADVFIVQNFGVDVNSRIMELLALIDCARRASAMRITVVIPYYPYAREDRKDESRVPITAKLVANLFMTAGADRVLTMDLHSAQMQGFFDKPVDHLYARPVLIRRLRHHLKQAQVDHTRLVVVASDLGAIKMARAWARALGTRLAAINKRRVSETETVIDGVVGEVAECVAVLVDDIIATAGTMRGDIARLFEEGATDVYLCATHGVLCGPARQRLVESRVRHVIVSDSVPHTDLPTKIEPVSVTLLFAEAIQRIHRNQSVRELFDDAFVDRLFSEHEGHHA